MIQPQEVTGKSNPRRIGIGERAEGAEPSDFLDDHVEAIGALLVAPVLVEQIGCHRAQTLRHRFVPCQD